MDLKPISLKAANDDFFDADVERIQIALASIGRSATRIECIVMWERYSDSLGWMALPDTDEQIVNCIATFYE